MHVCAGPSSLSARGGRASIHPPGLTTLATQPNAGESRRRWREAARSFSGVFELRRNVRKAKASQSDGFPATDRLTRTPLSERRDPEKYANMLPITRHQTFLLTSAPAAPAGRGYPSPAQNTRRAFPSAADTRTACARHATITLHSRACVPPASYPLYPKSYTRCAHPAPYRHSFRMTWRASHAMLWRRPNYYTDHDIPPCVHPDVTMPLPAELRSCPTASSQSRPGHCTSRSAAWLWQEMRCILPADSLNLCRANGRPRTCRCSIIASSISGTIPSVIHLEQV